MAYGYKQSVEMFWKEKADQLFKTAWVKIKEKASPKSIRDQINKTNEKLTEYEICKIFHNRLDWKWIKHTHTANESGQSWTMNIVIMMNKKKAIWVSSWFPDYTIYLEWKLWVYTLYIEMKKFRWKKWWLNWSTISEEQVAWVWYLEWWVWSYAWFAHWYEEAIELVEKTRLLINQ